MSYLPALHSAIFDRVVLVLTWLACVGLVALLGGIIINLGSGKGEKQNGN